ncbi:hypothetical protein CBQ26_17715 [Deinococcus indicus]|jgi:hypothetical protein|uniref:Uncharacterized protein n=2 Tax=Deinococcus TaxID=1298 RepID=A0A246BFG0_9DEIO|nr:hypothetical protein [Deinococcus indicus]OWL93910.1 hypothetical protein CBQ26_17715 [Deinococcus indicus]GHG15791.1 hypothetical protein GCM10017784_03050 [Deinococcus indicus]
MSVPRHFSDTRTEEGRVRILAVSGRVLLDAEGPGWQHRSAHPSLEDATLELALLPRVGADLYAAALNDIERQLRFTGPVTDDRSYPGAA